MLKINEIQTLIKSLDESSLDELVYEYDGLKLKLKKSKENTTVVESVPQTVTISPANQPNESPKAMEQETTEPTFDYQITSPMVGTFYLSSSPDSDPYVQVGDKVSKKSIVCIVEAMKLFNEIEAEVDGEIVEILAENGELVEYGQPLFGVKLN